MFYTLIKHGVLTNQSARRVLSILQMKIKPAESKTKWGRYLQQTIKCRSRKRKPNNY